MTVVPFLHDGTAVLVADGRRLALPAGAVTPGDDPLVDTVFRVTLERWGFRRQGTHMLAVSADHRQAVFWVDGARYHGTRPHRRGATWWTGPADQAIELLRHQGDGALARLLEAADQARLALTDEQFFADNQRLLDAAYLAASTPEGGSGFGGNFEDWREERSIICEAIDGDGTFLDVGCANGHLMDSVEQWCAERGVRVTGFGLDISEQLVTLAQRRLPHAADRLWVGNALSWTPPEGLRFDYVHTLLDCVPQHHRGRLVAHLLGTAVAPGGRLIVSHYLDQGPDHWAGAILGRLGYRVAGVTRRPQRPGRPPSAPSAWLDKPRLVGSVGGVGLS